MSSIIESNHYHDEAEALSTSWPVRRMAAELPEDLRLALVSDDSGVVDSDFMNKANTRFRSLANRDEQGLLRSIGGVNRALRLALIDLGMGAWSVDDVAGVRVGLDDELDDIDFDSVVEAAPLQFRVEVHHAFNLQGMESTKDVEPFIVEALDKVQAEAVAVRVLNPLELRIGFELTLSEVQS